MTSLSSKEEAKLGALALRGTKRRRGGKVTPSVETAPEALSQPSQEPDSKLSNTPQQQRAPSNPKTGGEEGATSRDPSPNPSRRATSSVGRGDGADSGAEGSSRRRSRRKEEPLTTTTPMATLSDLGGMTKVLEQLNELVGFPLAHPDLFQLLGTEPPTGVLLFGPPGTGKTRLAHALAHAVSVPFFALDGPEIVSGVSGDSEARLRTLFAEASAAAPSLIFIDEVDAIAGKREEAGKAMEARIVAQLQTCMDGLATLWRQQKKVVMVLGATSRPEVIEPALRRTGRFHREVGLGIPSLGERKEILEVLMRNLRTAEDVDITEIAFCTPGFVGSDLHAVIKEAAAICMRRLRKAILQARPTQDGSADQEGILTRVPIPENLDLESLVWVTKEDFAEAVTRVQPSSMREGFSTIPDVTWKDVGALEGVKEEMIMWVQRPIRFPGLYNKVGLGTPCGLLLFGPPGCGKTLVAKAIASEASANFISVKGPELLNKYVGESERAVRMVFARGRASAPCVLFFDELDALAPKRGMDRSTPGAERLVNQLLTEMDGVEGRDQVFVIAATNRVDMIDGAMMRPGRFDKVLYVPLPTPEQRVQVLKTLARKTPLHHDVDLEAVGKDPRCTGFSGADCKALVREAAMSAVRDVFVANGEDMKDERSLAQIENVVVTADHFETALARVRPSVSREDSKRYDELWVQQQRRMMGGE